MRFLGPSVGALIEVAMVVYLVWKGKAVARHPGMHRPPPLPPPSSFRGARKGEPGIHLSHGSCGVMDSGLSLREPRNDERILPVIAIADRLDPIVADRILMLRCHFC